MAAGNTTVGSIPRSRFQRPLNHLRGGKLFSRHEMTNKETEFLKDDLAAPVKIICAEPGQNDGYAGIWLTQGFYEAYRLRERNQAERWTVSVIDDGAKTAEIVERYNPLGELEERRIGRDYQIVSRMPNDWLVESPKKLLQLYKHAGLFEADALEVEIPYYGAQPAPAPTRDLSFGWYRALTSI